MRDFSLQPLERRMHLSVSTGRVALECPEVTEARQDLQETIVQYRRDRRDLARDLADIRTGVREEISRLKAEDGEAFDAVIEPLKQDLAEAFEGQAEAVREARMAIADVREGWEPILAADVKAFLDAKAAGDETALGEARAKLESDRSELKQDLKPLKDALDAVVTETRAAIETARDAIYDAYASLSPTLSDLLDKLKETAESGRDTQIGNHHAVVAAQRSLQDALEECRAEHDDHSVSI